MMAGEILTGSCWEADLLIARKKQATKKIIIFFEAAFAEDCSDVLPEAMHASFYTIGL